MTLDAYDRARLDGFQGSKAEFFREKYLAEGFAVVKSLGFDGTEDDLQKDIIGHDKAPLNAYELSVAYGFKGSARDWLESLKGLDGQSAFELAVSKGFNGSESDYLESLKGLDGLDAYQLALTVGFDGSLDEFIDSLKGKNATPDQIAAAVEAYLIANPPPKGDKGDKGDKGEQGDQGEQGEPPEHRWVNTALQFRNPDGTWGRLVELRGTPGLNEIIRQNVGGGGGGGSLSIQKFYDSSDDFPTPGKTQILYFDKSTDPYGVFVWTGTEYQQVGGGGSGSVFGLFKGSFDTFAEIEAVEAENGDWVILRADDGENESGIYVKADTGFVFSADLVTIDEQDIRHSFETVAQNLAASNATLSYSSGDLVTVEYASGITKSLSYNESGDLVTVTLSGATPFGISLVKTLAYSAGELVGITYSMGA